MKFSTRQDIDAPAAYVFERLSDFEGMERQAMRHGIEVARKAPQQGRGLGAGWRIRVPFRGKLRDVEAQVSEFDVPNAIAARAQSGGLDMLLSAELLALSPRRTRLTFGYDVRPRTLSARILVQSVKFAKNTFQKRFERRVTRFCEAVAEDYAGAPRP
ncbi:SRPBCC family protein [Celeribacter indicus]|uniref:Polyketide cyclase / dehydrase and lipid transport n=1 Tax=Celeribacter indicus TaxID=1208324 RepID=A0A0B5E9B8_9RHOB|nr:SRPBCC family protein [Celeribacter indicus]AJE48922.1 hypothetical protein P73_4207 [Celeribacter indicus]SDW41250.1 Polyketide cyclase / dehydrase and lipid transport [Celeribacter indicus]